MVTVETSELKLPVLVNEGKDPFKIKLLVDADGYGRSI